MSKGYSVDLIKDLLTKINSENFLIEVGGELITMGVNEKNTKWKVAIQNPIDLSSYYTEISIDGMSLATSGNYRKFRIDSQTGIRYAHIVNPIDGKSMTNNILSASVVSRSCIEADAWATSLMLMDPVEATKIINNIEDTEVGLINKRRWEIYNSKQDLINKEKSRLEKQRIKESDQNAKNIYSSTGTPIKGSITLANFLRRTNIHFKDLIDYNLTSRNLPLDVQEGVEIDIKYSGYLERQKAQINQLKQTDK